MLNPAEWEWRTFANMLVHMQHCVDASIEFRFDMARALLNESANGAWIVKGLRKRPCPIHCDSFGRSRNE